MNKDQRIQKEVCEYTYSQVTPAWFCWILVQVLSAQSSTRTFRTIYFFMPDKNFIHRERKVRGDEAPRTAPNPKKMSFKAPAEAQEFSPRASLSCRLSPLCHSHSFTSVTAKSRCHRFLDDTDHRSHSGHDVSVDTHLVWWSCWLSLTLSSSKPDTKYKLFVCATPKAEVYPKSLCDWKFSELSIRLTDGLINKRSKKKLSSQQWQ